MSKLILASNSPRRRELLTMANIDFEVIVKPTDESYPFDLSIEKIANYIALQKALAIQIDYPTRKIIAADTIVILNGQILGKPSNRDEAINMLQSLSGKAHEVITGVCILEGNQQTEFSEKTLVEFYPLTQAQIDYYVDHFKPFDKAGSYGIQEWIGAIGIKRIEGCYYNVVGLPLSRLISFL